MNRGSRTSQPMLVAFDADPAPDTAPSGHMLGVLQHAAQGGRRVLLIGPAGCGRSTLLRHWLAVCEPAAVVFVFAGTGARHRRTPNEFLYRLCAHIRTVLQEPDPVPVDAEGLREALPGWLARAGSCGSALIVLDDLDRLATHELAGEPDWLPDYLPPGVTLVASAAPGMAAGYLRNAGWDVVSMHDVRDRLAEQFAAGADATSPEARLLADTVDDPQATRLLSWLWAAPAGLPRNAMRAEDAAPESLVPYLRADDDRVTLCHERLRDAVADYRLRDGAARRQAHRDLAGIEPDSLQRAWHLAHAREWSSLLEWLTTPQLLGRLDDERFALTALWNSLPARDVAASHLLDTLTGLRKAGETPADDIVRSHGAGADLLGTLGAGEQIADLLEAGRRHLAARDDAPCRDAIAALDHNLGVHLSENGNGAAEEVLHRAFTVRRARFGADHPATRSSRHALATWHEGQGDLDAAETLYQEALAAHEARGQSDAVTLIAHLGNLAGVHRARNRLEAARPLLERALRLAVDGPGRDHPSYAACLDNLAGLLYTGQAYEQALERYREALSVTERLFGPDHPATAACTHNLGTTLDAMERYREAEELYRRALAIRHAAYGEEHAETATSLHNLAGVLDVIGRREEAETLYRRAVAVWMTVAGERHPTTATSLNNLADLLREMHRHHEAEPLYRANLATWQELLGDEHPNTLMTAAELGGLYADTGHYSEAERLLREAVDRLERVMGTDNLLHVDAACRLARVLRETGRGAEAVALLEQRYERAKATIAVLSPRIQKLHRHLAVARGADGGGGQHER